MHLSAATLPSRLSVGPEILRQGLSSAAQVSAPKTRPGYAPETREDDGQGEKGKGGQVGGGHPAVEPCARLLCLSDAT